MSLINNTFEWLKKEWADEVDFVVCEFESRLCFLGSVDLLSRDWRQCSVGQAVG